MKLSIETVITPEKIINYLLIAKKRNDKSKWLNDAGYTQENWQRFENDLRTQILSLDAVQTAQNEYGQMDEIRGTLSGPNGKTLHVCSIWMQEYQTGLTKFITIYPDKRRSER